MLHWPNAEDTCLLRRCLNVTNEQKVGAACKQLTGAAEGIACTQTSKLLCKEPSLRKVPI
jgi:hypothetical protein